MDVINDQKKEEKEVVVVDTKKSLRPKRREIKDDLMQERDGWSNQEGGWGNIKNVSSSYLSLSSNTLLVNCPLILSFSIWIDGEDGRESLARVRKEGKGGTEK